jgi:hypothetical protein
MTDRLVTRAFRVVALALLAAVRAQAQSEAGTVAAVQGTFEVERAGNWQAATVGLPVFVGDRLRTGPAGRGKVVFQDDTVLDVAPNTEIMVEKQVFDPSGHRFQALLRLAKGKIRAWVSDYYREPRARYEIETPTAVAGVRGTEFIALYDSATESTEVVGIAAQVEVSGKLAVIGPAVQIGPQDFTQVQKGRFPTPPQHLDEARFQQYIQGLDLIGTGRRDGLNVLHPAVAGRVLAPEDIAGPPSGRVAGKAAAGRLGTAAPEEFLANRVSADVRTNTQPLLDFRQTPPGRAPTGAVRVGF